MRQMKKIRIALTPLEPYFFGNDKNLKYVDPKLKKTKAANYYAVSEKIPSQSTLFGVLRYLGLTMINSDYLITDTDKANIGSQSFHLSTPNKNGFGKIISISNLFLMRNQIDDEKSPDYYVRMPLDHKACNDCPFDNPPTVYEPFPSTYYQKVLTSQGERLLPVKYPVKSGFADGFVNLKDGTYVKDEDIFKKVEAVGIQVDKKEDGYYKRVRYHLENDYSLTFFACVEDDFALSKEELVYMGYGKSMFKVKTHVMDNDDKLPDFTLLTKELILKDCTKRVALSDIYVSDCITKLYQCCSYVNTQSREYREFYTKYGKSSQKERFKRGTNYIRLIKAGSVFYVNNKDIDLFDSIINNENAKIAGFNIMTGDDKE